MTNERQPMPDADLQDELDLKSIVEATFGPGAFDLLDGEEAVEPHTDVEAAAESSAEATATQPEGSPTEVRVPASPTSTELSRKFVLFDVAEHLFAIPVSSVSEIQREPPITRIPHVPQWVSGVTNLRGSIISVVDLPLRLGLPSPQAGIRRRLIVIRSPVSSVTTALLVDRVLGIRVLPNEPTALLDSDELVKSLDLLEDTAAQFASEWREMDMQPVAVLDLEKAIDLNQPTQ